MYTLKFAGVSDCDRVYEQQPWNFRRSLFARKRIQGDERPEDVRVQLVPFWVQILGLPLQYMSSMVAKLIGNVLGRIMFVVCWIISKRLVPRNKLLGSTGAKFVVNTGTG